MSEPQEYNANPLIPLLLVVALSAYALYMCYQNITRLQEYEEQTQKAAKWSSNITERLYRTRATQSTGTASVCLLTLWPRYVFLMLM